MSDQKVIVIDNQAEIEMMPIDAAHAIRVEPQRYSMAMIEMHDATTDKTQLIPKAEALKMVGEHSDRYSIVHPAQRPVLDPKEAPPTPPPAAKDVK